MVGPLHQSQVESEIRRRACHTNSQWLPLSPWAIHRSYNDQRPRKACTTCGTDESRGGGQKQMVRSLFHLILLFVLSNLSNHDLTSSSIPYILSPPRRCDCDATIQLCLPYLLTSSKGSSHLTAKRNLRSSSTANTFADYSAVAVNALNSKAETGLVTGGAHNNKHKHRGCA